MPRAAENWLRSKVDTGFAVVMGGTAQTPDAYTGRASIPGFQDVGTLMVLRIAGGSEQMKSGSGQFLTTPEAGLATYRRLSLGRYACPVGEASARSEIGPIWLMHPGGSACGLLEDTRKAKRLILNDGLELRSAHLSCFAWSTVSAGAELIRVALQRGMELGIPALFVAVAEPDAEALRAALPNLEVAAYPATVYGAGLTPGLWNINSAEI